MKPENIYSEEIVCVILGHVLKDNNNNNNNIGCESLISSERHN